MFKILFFIALFFIQITLLYSITLQDMFDNASASGEFDKVIELEFGETYTGGLEIDGSYDDAINLQIIGNGAILDMLGERIAFSNMDKELNVQDLIITNGYIFFNGLESEPNGIVKNITFYNPKNYAVLMTHCGTEITIERNIVVEALPIDFFGTNNPTGVSFGLDKDDSYEFILDNWSYNSPNGNFLKLCNTGWGVSPEEWAGASSAPNNNIIGIDPLVDPENGYQVQAGSPAIGYGVETVTSSSLEDNYELAITNYELKQNYPNPFNPVTKIGYQLSVNSEQLAEIVVYNSAGQQVWFSLLTAHSSQFTGSILFDGSKFDSGVYYYSLVVDGNRLSTKSMILIK